MGKLIYLFCISCLVSSSPWLDNFSQAKQEAHTHTRPILMVFAGSDWCKPCIRLKKEVWESADFQALADSQLVLLYLDFPRYKKNRLADSLQQHHAALAEQYNPKGQFPHVLLLDAAGKPQASLTAKTSQKQLLLPALQAAITEYHASLSH